ncbi:MAG: sulfite exporter TauE/SafE family protein [Casimicrobiaceae bacterium]
MSPERLTPSTRKAARLSFAAVNYQRGGLVDWKYGVPILAADVVLAPVGARLTPYVNKGLLLGLFAAFLVFAGGAMLFRQARPGENESNSGTRAATCVGVGGIAGFLRALLGVGGGNIIVPALNWVGLDPKLAAGTSAPVVVLSSLSGFLGHVGPGGIEPKFVGMMALMAAGGSMAGSQLMKTRVSGSQLKRVIGVVLWLVAAKMIFDLHE